MSALPVGWRRTTLGQLGRYHNGRAFKKAEWKESGRPIIRIQNLTGSNSSFNHFQGDAEERHVARPGDLLVSWAATLGAYFWAGPEGVVNQHIFKVESDIDRRFHKYLLDFKLSDLKRHTHGSGMVHITRGRFDAEPVSVPKELREQRHIVEILEDHLSRLDAAETYLALSAQRLSRLREHVIEAAITGSAVPGERCAPRLQDVGTSDGILPPLPIGWAWRRLGEFAEVVGGVTKDSGRQSDPSFVTVPYLRVANVQRGALKLDDIATMKVSPTKAQALLLRRGDVLLNEGGDRDKLARGWVWQEEIEGCIHQNHVFRARVGDQLDPYFLSWTANTFGGRWAERNGKQSVNLASISLTMIRHMPVIVPPAGVSALVVHELHARLESFQRLANEASAAQARGRLLRRAVLAAAFEGKLTGRHTDDEVIEEEADAKAHPRPVR